MSSPLRAMCEYITMCHPACLELDSTSHLVKMLTFKTLAAFIERISTLHLHNNSFVFLLFGFVLVHIYVYICM